MTLSLIGGHMTKNGLGANYPSRICLSIAGNGLGEQHPDTIVLFRDVTIYNDGPPDLHTHPQRRTIEYAQFWYNQLRPIWQANAHRVHYFTITNELGGSSPEHIQDHIAFEANICQLAHADGLHCAVGKLAGDTPNWNTNLWEELYAPFIVDMWNQYGAIYARHVYGGDLVDSNGVPTDDPPGNPQRAIFEADHLRRLGYGGGMVLAECGIDGGYGVADYGRFRAQALGYEAALRPYADIIIGLCFWECGTSGFEANYTGHLQDLRPLLDTSLPKWEGNSMSDKPKIVIVKKPSKDSMTEAENEAANDYAWNNYGRTTTHSHDDMLTMLAAGNDESYAVVCWPERQPDTVQMLESAGYDWVMFPEGVPPPPQWTKLPVPHLSQYGPGADARANDCGAAAAAMVIRGMTTNSPTVDNIAIAYQTTPNAYMNFTHIDNALNGYGMDGTRRQPYTPEQISATIVSGKPVIALVWYKGLPRQFSTFNGSHFIPIYGTDKNGRLLYRDPLAPTGFSEELVITYAQLDNAMSGVTAEGNQPNQAMDCVKKNEPPPSGKSYNTADFMIPDPRVWLVLDRGPAGGEDVFTVFKNGREERVKNHQQKEVYSWRNGAPWRILDTSPAPQSNGRKRMYKQTTNGQPGGQIAPAQCVEGVTYTFYSDVQYYAMDNCQPLSENSGTNAPSTFKLIKRHEGYTFPNGFKVDVLWETIQTGEYQLYMEKDGIKCGWCGGGAKQANNNWSAIPKEMYINRAIPTAPADGC